MSFSPVRLNHAVLFVADLERSVSFYETTFGMEVMAREPRANAAFLRLPRSGNHHDLGLFEVGAGAGPKRRGAIGLYHLAWQLGSRCPSSERCVHRPVQPRRDQERLRRRS
jgi:catechol 2,3-dioxygenase-like lactoylglutathione lyase family enzyme